MSSERFHIENLHYDPLLRNFHSPAMPPSEEGYHGLESPLLYQLRYLRWITCLRKDAGADGGTRLAITLTPIPF